MFTIISQTPFSCQFSGDPLIAFNLFKEMCQRQKGRIKSAQPSTGILDVRFRYGINLFGLRIQTRLQNDGNNLHTFTVSGDFVDAADTFGAADKKAEQLLGAFVTLLLNHQPPVSASVELPQPAPVITTPHSGQPAASAIASGHTPIMTVQNPRNLAGQWGTLTNTGFFKWFALLNAGIAMAGTWTLGAGFFLPFIGFAGVLLTLPLSRYLAKKAHGVTVIQANHPEYGTLHQMVATLAQQAGLPTTPEVGVYVSADMNAFATGSSHQSSIVAFSTALLEKLSAAEVQAVAAHEIGHIVSRDMLAMAVLQGMINSIVLVCSLPLQALRAINWLSKDRSEGIEWMLWAARAVIVFCLTTLGNLVLMGYSRRREYRADAMAALLVGKASMVSALATLSQETETPPQHQAAYSAMKIVNPASWLEWFSSHPSPQNRIEALKQETYMRLALQ